MLPVSDAMRAALTGAEPDWDFGVDLLDGQDRPVEDISMEVLSLSVEHSLHAEDVHRSCSLELTRDLRWGVDRVRPWISVWDGVTWDAEEVVERGPVVRTNLFENPRFRSNYRIWTMLSAPVYGVDGGNAVGMVSTGSTARVGIYYAPVEPLPAGTYEFSIDALPVVPGVRMRVLFTGPGGAPQHTAVLVDTEVSVRATHTATVTVSFPINRIYIEWIGDLPATAGTLVGYFDRGMISPTLGPYFDGDNAATARLEYAWSGTPGASTSVAREVSRRVVRTPQTHRWPLGVFLLTSPEEVAGEEPRTRDVTGVDKLWLLQRQVGDTYVIPAGTSYLDAIRQVLIDAGVPGRLLLDGDRQDTLLDEPAVWPLLEGGYTWLDVVNGLLGMIAYQGLWADEQGRFRSAPTRPAAEQPTVWTFDATDVLKGIVGEERRRTADVYHQPNYWRFVRKRDAALTADDVYVVDRTEGLPLEQRRPKVLHLDVADRAALVAEGDRIVAEDTHSELVVSFDTNALPLEHGDVVELRDPELGLPSRRGVVRRWSINDDGSMALEIEVI